MQFIAFDHFHFRPEYPKHHLFKPLAGIATIDQHLVDLGQAIIVEQEHQQRAVAVIYVRRRHRNRMRQTLRIDGNVSLDSRHLLAGVIAFALRRIGVLDALRVHDAKARRGLPSVVLAFLCHLIFLMPALAGFPFLRRARASNDRSGSAPCSATGSHPARRATSRHSLASTGSRRRCRTNPISSVPFSSSIPPVAAESARIALG